MMEAAVLLDAAGNPIHWHAPEDRSAVSLPDSRKLWDEIWNNRGRAVALAHSHPGTGLTGPSITDMTTFDAIERALGRPLVWLIATDNRLVRCRRVRIDTVTDENRRSRRAHAEIAWITEEELLFPTARWLPRLRELSNYGGNNG